MREHVFADETKAKGFALAAAFVMPEELARKHSRPRPYASAGLR
jgi:hypothetical protein